MSKEHTVAGLEDWVPTRTKAGVFKLLSNTTHIQMPSHIYLITLTHPKVTPSPCPPTEPAPPLSPPHPCLTSLRLLKLKTLEKAWESHLAPLFLTPHILSTRSPVSYSHEVCLESTPAPQHHLLTGTALWCPYLCLSDPSRLPTHPVSCPRAAGSGSSKPGGKLGHALCSAPRAP